MLKWLRDNAALLSAFGVASAAVFGAGVSWNNLNGRVSRLEAQVKELKTPQSARAQICSDLMREWISQTGSTLPQGTTELEVQLDRYKCPELASEIKPALAAKK
jgi:hypothetical protein